MIVMLGLSETFSVFGDGATSSSQNPMHTYAKDTIYNACLSIYDGSSCSYTLCQNVSITTGIAVVTGETAWNIYPDPTSDYFFISGNDACL